MEIRLLHGAAIAPYIDDLARLRLSVFREFPYLYDGTPQYEADYLSTYARSGRSLAVLAIDQGQVVGPPRACLWSTRRLNSNSRSWPKGAILRASTTSASRCYCRLTGARAWVCAFHRARVLRSQARRIRLLRVLLGRAAGRASPASCRLQALARLLAQSGLPA